MPRSSAIVRFRLPAFARSRSEEAGSRWTPRFAASPSASSARIWTAIAARHVIIPAGSGRRAARESRGDRSPARARWRLQFSRRWNRRHVQRPDGGAIQDAWTLAGGGGDGRTCCQADDLLNAVSTLDRRIDLVLFRGAVTPLAATVVGNRPVSMTPSLMMWPSDHAGVAATLRLRQP